MRVLTRRSLAAFTRWSLQDERGRRAMLESGQIADGDSRALLQLESNVEAHPPEAWFREAAASLHGLVTADAPEAIMADLCLRDDVTMALLAQVLPGLTPPRRFLLRQALDKWLAGHPERVVTKTRQEEPMATQLEAVRAVVERFPDILSMEMPWKAKARLGELAGGIPAGSAGACLSALRGQMGKGGMMLRSWQDPPGWNGALEAATVTASTPPAPAAVPGEPEAAEGAAVAVSEQASEAQEAPAPQAEAGEELAASTEVAGPEALALAFLRSLPPAPWAQANGHVELTPADRQFALQLAAGVGHADDLAELDLPRRRAVLELAARAVTLAAG